MGICMLEDVYKIPGECILRLDNILFLPSRSVWFYSCEIRTNKKDVGVFCGNILFVSFTFSDLEKARRYGILKAPPAVPSQESCETWTLKASKSQLWYSQSHNNVLTSFTVITANAKFVSAISLWRWNKEFILEISCSILGCINRPWMTQNKEVMSALDSASFRPSLEHQVHFRASDKNQRELRGKWQRREEIHVTYQEVERL